MKKSKTRSFGLAAGASLVLLIFSLGYIHLYSSYFGNLSPENPRERVEIKLSPVWAASTCLECEEKKCLEGTSCCKLENGCNCLKEKGCIERGGKLFN